MKVVVLSPRVPAGLMSAAAWDAVRSAERVVSAAEGPHVDAIRAAGVTVAIGTAEPTDDVVWIPAPGDSAFCSSRFFLNVMLPSGPRSTPNDECSTSPMRPFTRSRPACARRTLVGTPLNDGMPLYKSSACWNASDERVR